jgi:hypothetical protein
MTYSELIQLYFDRSTALQWYWTIYVIVIGGLLAFSSLRKQKDAVTGILVTVLYICFAYKNLGAIQDVTREREAVLSNIRSYQAEGSDSANLRRLRDALEPTLAPTDYAGVTYFHIASDVLTIAALWAMEWRRRRNEPLLGTRAL